MKAMMTAIQTEREMQNYREENNFTGLMEKEIVGTMVKNSKSNMKIGDKTLMYVPPYYIHIPSWQRNLSVQRALSIGQNYDPNKWELPKVVYENGKLIVIDGQHRIFGAFKGEIEYVLVEMLEMSEKEAIDLFIDQSDIHKNMRPVDTYRAAIAAGRTEWILFRDICKKNNVAIYCDMEPIKNPVGVFSSIRDGIKTVEQSPETFDKILRLITELQWNGSENCYSNAFSAKVFRSIKKLYAYYEDDADKMEKILLENCKGNEFFISQIKWREQCSVFDYLSQIVNDGLKIEPIKGTKGKKKVA